MTYVPILTSTIDLSMSELNVKQMIFSFKDENPDPNAFEDIVVGSASVYILDSRIVPSYIDAADSITSDFLFAIDTYLTKNVGEEAITSDKRLAYITDFRVISEYQQKSFIENMLIEIDTWIWVEQVEECLLWGEPTTLVGVDDDEEPSDVFKKIVQNIVLEQGYTDFKVDEPLFFKNVSKLSKSVLDF